MINTLLGPSGLVFIGGFLCIIGAFWASQKRGDFERQLNEKNEKIIGLTQDITSKNEQVLQLTKEAANSVIGGDSYCYMKIISINQDTNVGLLAFIHHGKYPLYDVNARIFDPQRTIINPTNIDEFLAANMRVSLGGIPACASTYQGKFSLGASEKRDFNIFFDARNGFFTQLLRLRKANGKWYSATRVKREEQVILEEIDEGFPIDVANITDWDKMP